MIHSAQRILIVEDNKTDSRLIRELQAGRSLLEHYGYETLQTGDGFEAMKLALACLPDGYPITRNIGVGSDPSTQR